jgi:hypothetical protein
MDLYVGKYKYKAKKQRESATMIKHPKLEERELPKLNATAKIIRTSLESLGQSRRKSAGITTKDRRKAVTLKVRGDLERFNEAIKVITVGTHLSTVRQHEKEFGLTPEGILEKFRKVVSEGRKELETHLELGNPLFMKVDGNLLSDFEEALRQIKSTEKTLGDRIEILKRKKTKNKKR